MSKNSNSLPHRNVISCPDPSTENALQRQRTPKCQIQNHVLIITRFDFSGELDTIDSPFLEALFLWLLFSGKKKSSLPSSSVLLYVAFPLPKIFLTLSCLLGKKSLPAFHGPTKLSPPLFTLPTTTKAQIICSHLLFYFCSTLCITLL